MNYKQIVEQITNVGVDEDLDFYSQLKYRALNWAVALVLVVLIVLTIADIINNDDSLYADLVAIVLTAAYFVLRHYKYHFLVLIYFTVVYPTLLLVLSILYGEELNITYIFFAFIVIVLLGFDQKWPRIILSVYIFLLQVISIYYSRYYGSLLERDTPFLDGFLILALPIVGVAYLILSQISTIRNLYEEQKKYNEELTKKNETLKELVKLNDAKNHLLAIIAHDLKGPAYAFNNLTKKIAFLMKKEEPERIEKLAYDFEIAGSKLYYTISNLLNWVTTQRGNIVAHKRAFALASLLDEVLNNLKFQNQDKNIKISYDFNQGKTLTTDPDILGIILFNLINNAIKYSHQNGTVLVKSLTDAASERIEIVDSGVGMDADLISQITSGDEILSTSAALHERGHGIGLKICYALVQHLGGTIKIESEVGTGSVFSITIPA